MNHSYPQIILILPFTFPFCPFYTDSVRGIEFDTTLRLHCLLRNVGKMFKIGFTVLTCVALMCFFPSIVLMSDACFPWLDCCWHAVFCIQITFLAWLMDQIVVLFCIFTNYI